MNVFLKLALGLCVVTLVTANMEETAYMEEAAMQNDTAEAKQGGPMRLQDLNPGDLEDAINFIRHDIASMCALEIAKHLDDPVSVSKVESIHGGCKKIGNLLECCASVSIHKFSLINFDAKVCISGEYLPEVLGVRFRLTVNGNIIIEEVLLGRNPPPICASVPGFRRILSICMKITDLEISSNGFGGCFALSAKFFSKTILTVRLGCIHNPLDSTGSPTRRRHAAGHDYSEKRENVHSQ